LFHATLVSVTKNLINKVFGGYMKKIVLLLSCIACVGPVSVVGMGESAENGSYRGDPFVNALLEEADRSLISIDVVQPRNRIESRKAESQRAKEQRKNSRAEWQSSSALNQAQSDKPTQKPSDYSFSYFPGAAAAAGFTDAALYKTLKDREAFKFLDGSYTKNLSSAERRALKKRFFKQLGWALATLGAGVSTGAGAYFAAKETHNPLRNTLLTLLSAVALEQGAKFAGRKGIEAYARRQKANKEADAEAQPTLVPAKVGA
jgi:hypothetical protein